MIARFKKNSYQWSPLAVILIIILVCISLPDALGGKGLVSSTAKHAPETVLRRVILEKLNWPISPPSLDGKYICGVDWSTGNLAVHELTTGNEREVTNKKGAWDDSADFAYWSLISPESTKVAYLWCNDDKDENFNFELRLTDLNGSEPQVLYQFEKKDMYAFLPIGWSSDNTEILGAFSRNGELTQIVWVSTVDGSMRTATTLGQEVNLFGPESFRGDRTAKFNLSPDGRYLAYEAPQQKGSPKFDIFVSALDRKYEICLVSHAANDMLMGWTPDGRHIVFASDRTGTRDAWSLRVVDGKPEGLPERVKSQIGNIDPLGFAPDGSYYYGLTDETWNVYVVKLDPETGKVLSPPRAVRHTGLEGSPDWSPDGRYLAYCSRKETDKSQAIHLQTLATGQERTLVEKLPYFIWLRWSPDGRSVLITGFEEETPHVVYKLDVQTGKRTTLLSSDEMHIRGAELSSDGKTLFYLGYESTSKTKRLMARDLETGQEKELLQTRSSGTPVLRRWALSPDGQQLVLSTRLKLTDWPWALRIISAKGGESKKLVEGGIGEVAWTADGRDLLFVKDDSELWRVSAEGEEPRKLWEWKESFRDLRVNPDGQHIAFATRGYMYEVWVMENFLPAAPVAKPDHKPDFRKIRIPTKPGNGVLSPDGKKLAFVSKRSIWVVPVHGKVSPDIAGEPVRLPGTKGAWRWGLSWSADGKWIAYNTLPSEDHVGICIVPSSGGKVKRIVNRYRAGVSIHNYLLSLSPDGKIVAFTSEEKEKIQLFTVNVEGGDVNQLTEDGCTQPAFSPDGEKIAYVKEKPQKTEIRKSDVWVIPAAGGTPVQVSDLPGEATGPIWSPDGKMIAFIGDSKEKQEICIVPVSETGNPEASPTQIELPLGTRDFLAGWTPDNKIGALLMNPIHFAIYTVPASGGNATQVTPQGYTFSPRWSPDGERIYFRWTDGPDGIASVPSEGGEISISPIDANSMIPQPLQWGGDAVSPDGEKIVFAATKEENKLRSTYIYTIPVEGGEPKQLTISPGWDRFPCWSPEGKSIAFVRYSEASWNEIEERYIMNICIVRTEGGEVRQLTSESDKVAWATIAWSPDGKSIAYYSEDKKIRVIPVQGGEPRIVTKVNEVSGWSEMDWSRDGKKLAYSSKGSIWVVSLDGGEPEEIKTGLDARATHLSWSPDGEKIAFTASQGGDTELWLMENFLPAEGK